MHRDLALSQSLIYAANGLAYSPAISEPEGQSYAAHSFSVASQQVQFRVAKTTPTKPGHFVTLWRRSQHGPIRPFQLSDQVEVFVVCVRHKGQFGQFVFRWQTLQQHGIVAASNSAGKRAFRVYPPWSEEMTPSELNKQAKASQDWQLASFLPIDEATGSDPARTKSLYLG